MATSRPAAYNIGHPWLPTTTFEAASAVQYLAPLGRFLLALIFVASAAGKLADWQGTANMMTDKGLPAVDALLSVAIALEILGGLSVVLGLYARMGALALLVFLVPVSLVMHDFWTMPEGPERMQQMINFMKNVSIAGGVTMILALGPGPLSIDSIRVPRTASPPPSLPGA